MNDLENRVFFFKLENSFAAEGNDANAGVVFWRRFLPHDAQVYGRQWLPLAKQGGRRCCYISCYRQFELMLLRLTRERERGREREVILLHSDRNDAVRVFSYPQHSLLLLSVTNKNPQTYVLDAHTCHSVCQHSATTHLRSSKSITPTFVACRSLRGRSNTAFYFLLLSPHFWLFPGKRQRLCFKGCACASVPAAPAPLYPHIYPKDKNLK